MCGTWKPRAGAQIPDELLPVGFEAARTADQGDGVQMGDVHGPMYADSGLVAWAWMDSAHINLLTTINQTDEVGTLERRSSSSLARGERGHGKAERAASLCAICYNKKMLGTDKCDQMRGTYSPQRRSNKPWKALFIWTLDVSCVNAWALWKKSSGLKVITTASHLGFQQRLVEELLDLSGRTFLDRQKLDRAMVGRRRTSRVAITRDGKGPLPSRPSIRLANSVKTLMPRKCLLGMMSRTTVTPIEWTLSLGVESNVPETRTNLRARLAANTFIFGGGAARLARRPATSSS